MNQQAQRVAIGLGSNLCKPRLQLRTALSALRRLPGTRFCAVSPVYRNPPFGPPTQPAYLNAVATLHTRLPPLALLRRLQAIEHRQGRRRGQRWGARTLDLDILLYGEQAVQTRPLTLPHPEMAKRDFVLYPLAEIASDWKLPDGRTIRSLIRARPGAHLRRISY